MKIVETDNYGGDYPNETELPIPRSTREKLQPIADAINELTGEHASRYWKVVENEYKLQPGFEP